MTDRLAPGPVLVALALSGALLVAPRAARACSCKQQTVQVAFDQAVAVFEGHVLEVSDAAANAQGDQRRTVRFNVVSQWKGAEDETLTLTTAGDGAQCGYGFTVGQSYLVYASAGEGGGLEVSLCSRTRPMSEAQEDLATLGMGSTPVNPKGETPPTSTATKPEPPARGGCAGCATTNDASGAYAAIPIVLAVALRLRKRRRELSVNE